MKKRKHKKSKSRQFLGLNKALTYFILTFSLLAFVITMIIISYNMGFEEAKDAQSMAMYKTKAQNKLLRSRLQETLGHAPLPTPTVYPQAVLQPMKNIQTPPVQIESPYKSPLPVVNKPKMPSPKPKLAIILDDVSYAAEVRQVKALGIKVNFSFFPPTKRHPQTANLARQEPFYMVHLPLEAMSYTAEEPSTLHIGDSLQRMKQRLKDIKKDFPRLRYMNNHTGSKFTSNFRAVRRLYKAARSYDLDIVDSRTIASTKLPQVYEGAGRKLLSRDIFLDHEADVSYICGQIKQAVDKAVQRGKAIAIGHPRRTTIQALRRCKSYLEPVDLVYVTEL